MEHDQKKLSTGYTNALETYMYGPGSPWRELKHKQVSSVITAPFTYSGNSIHTINSKTYIILINNKQYKSRMQNTKYTCASYKQPI